MTLTDLKALAEKFRAVADDKTAVTKLADDTPQAHRGDHDVSSLCDRFRAAADGAAVRAICDEVKARTK